jgi:hypothetical protein
MTAGLLVALEKGCAWGRERKMSLLLPQEGTGTGRCNAARGEEASMVGGGGKDIVVGERRRNVVDLGHSKRILQHLKTNRISKLWSSLLDCLVLSFSH